MLTPKVAHEKVVVPDRCFAVFSSDLHGFALACTCEFADFFQVHRLHSTLYVD
jgi:hypothetical protein